MKNKNLKAKIKELYSKNSHIETFNKDLNNFIAPIPSYDKYLEYDQSEPYKFIEKYSCLERVPNLCNTVCFLYHGIRFQYHLEKLESIFEKKAILASKHLNNCFIYEDNCNDGEYVSLLEIDPWEYSSMYEAFIRPNVTLVVSPFCEAYNTIYVPFNEWEEIKKSNRTFRNRFSYAKNEYQVKDRIPLDQVVAIGIPYCYLGCQNKLDYANKLLEDVIELMHKYNLALPVVDTSASNEMLYNPKEERKL